MTVDAAFIADEEGFIGHPYWPQGVSGVTLDYGYDLGQQDAATFQADWGEVLDGGSLRRLQACLGLKGAMAGAVALSSSIQGIRISKAQAITVFGMRTVPRYFALACQTFPGLDTLPNEVQTALTSLCVNRGGIPAHTHPDADGNDRYNAERAIVQYVAESNVEAIAGELEAMGADGPGELWPGDTPPHPGLRARRKNEGALCRKWLATRAAA